ncbi:MAG: mismatch repair protein MutS domain protein [Acidobacteriaceae bacterium]|nr:mismatch repair protein MutS domain protein [Acidobacteriaceae bacterium]
MTTPSEHYRVRLATVTAEQQHASRRGSTLLLILLAGIAVTGILGFAAHRGHLPSYPSAIFGVMCVVVLPWLLKIRYTDAYRLTSLVDHLEAGLARIKGEPPLTPRTGEEFRDPAHLYDRDLDILGPNSLFSLLSTVRTHLAERHLARTLLSLPPHEASLAHQTTVQVLTPKTELRERIALLGDTPIHQIPATLFEAWLDEPPLEAPASVRPVLQVTAVLLIACGVAGGFHFAAWPTLYPNIAAILALQSAIALYLRGRIQPILERASRLAAPAALLREGLSLMQSETFTDPALQNLQAQATTPANAQELLGKLQTQLTLLEQRTKEWFYFPGLALCIGTKATLAIEAWRRLHGPDLRRWLDAWAEFETLSALATYAFEHPASEGYSYPELPPPSHPATYEATGLAHPLLPAHAVRNTIALNSETRFYLISGSNMAGKSTLLRTLGLNAVLAALGVPVRATRARLSPFQIGASLALTDSLADGKSKFLAEVERLSHILALTEPGKPTLFLIDEIFSGTNSLDRRTAAGAILHQLMRNGAIGALSTHDLTLTELADLRDLHGLNLHMASPDPDDPLAFDYLLKPGINQSSNALAILRMMGLET